MAMLEAMACGKPLLIADPTEGGSTDFVSYNGLLFKAGDPEDLAAIGSSTKNGCAFDHASPLRSQAGGTC
jgi:glycosyltransferase involved in cell wall biosynthesis